MDELSSSLGFPCSKEIMLASCGQQKSVELEITKESGSEKKVLERQSKRENIRGRTCQYEGISV
jgi:hypothetical protein